MDQHVKLYYLGESPALQTQKPYLISTGLLKSIPQCNWKYEGKPDQSIKDARGCEEDFTLSKQGFTFQQWTPSWINWEDENEIKRTFLPEAREFLLRHLDLGDSLKRCEVFDWRVSPQRLDLLGVEDSNRGEKKRGTS